MVPIFPCCPSGTILLRTKVIFSKRMRRLISNSVNYMLGNRYISYEIIQGTSTAFPLLFLFLFRLLVQRINEFKINEIQRKTPHLILKPS